MSIVLGGPLAPAQVPTLWERVKTLVEGRPALVECDVAAIRRADAEVVEALCRLQVAARRAGCRIVLRHPHGELRDLLELMGLSEVVPCGSDLETRREPEQREPPPGIEEKRDAGDPIP